MIEKSSQTWLDVSAYIKARTEKLKEELWSGKFTHNPELDSARRVGISELDLLVDKLTKKPEPQND